DYVLYGKNGLPLAIVEAKRTMKSPKEGRQQAKLYADLLEKKKGQKPVVFYTNGFETWMIEEPYPAREVSGFYTQDELQLIIDRRETKRSLNSITINDDITNRFYQKEAIINTCEAFENRQRESLLVMATGSGKTRTVISIVDVLTQANWAKNVLFLADRTSLVKQAFRNFNQLLPNLSLCNLLEANTEKNNPRTSRMIFSTYPTMMNAIDSVKHEENRLFTVGHFDLIIVDEAHRSIYQKYRAIFDYFDSLIVGLLQHLEKILIKIPTTSLT
ncbi:MAG: DEAD/DEAH box helicase family protein, partial [Lactococcus lactis]